VRRTRKARVMKKKKVKKMERRKKKKKMRMMVIRKNPIGEEMKEITSTMLQVLIMKERINKKMLKNNNKGN